MYVLLIDDLLRNAADQRVCMRADFSMNATPWAHAAVTRENSAGVWEVNFVYVAFYIKLLSIICIFEYCYLSIIIIEYY